MQIYVSLPYMVVMSSEIAINVRILGNFEPL